MGPERSRLVRQTTFGLLALASAAVEVAAVDGRPLWTSLGMAAAWAALAAGLGWFVPTPKDVRRTPPRLVALLLLAFAAGPFVFEPLRRQWSGDGYPLELQMVFALRNLGLGLAVFAVWPLCLRLACVVSLFLMLFAVVMTDHPAELTLLGMYSAAGSVWLMLVYWTGLSGFLVTSASVAVEVQRERLPWFALFAGAGVVASVLGLVTVGPQRAARALWEWLPTSGGTGGYDPFARGGLNDGDDDVKGPNARSTGTAESDMFLDSPLPSLYDMANDMYGEPFKPREQERAIALDGQTKAKESHKPPADNLRPNREFSTARKSPRQPREPADRAARALFEVQGRTPLHIRATVFDHFDGIAWQEASLNPPARLFEKEPNSCWMRIRGTTPAAHFSASEVHQFKITSPLGWLLPAPPHLVRFRVGRVDQADFFAWGREQVLRMALRQTPSGISVETESCAVDSRLLGAAGSLTATDGSAKAAPPANLDSDVAAQARQWASGLPNGWPQIDAVVQRLRAEYVVDRSARVPLECRDPLAHFLLQSRRGPDYQFATAAAVLLRVLGYRTRLASGFYVAPEHYDPLARHTPVVAEDLHVWAEVALPAGDWLVIEPTPGYEVLGPNLPWSERALAALRALLWWLWDHCVAVTLCVVGLAYLWRMRLHLLDTLATSILRLFPGQSWQRCVRRVLWLLERRGRWVGRPRPVSQTHPAWLRVALPAGVDEAVILQQLTQMAEWSAYAPDLTPPWKAAEVRNVCRRALDEWTLRHWRAILASDRN